MRHWRGAGLWFEPVEYRAAGNGAGNGAGRVRVEVDPEGEGEAWAGAVEGKRCAFDGCSAVFAPDRNRRYCGEHSTVDRRRAARKAAGEAWAAAVGVFGRPVWLGGEAEGGFGWWQYDADGWRPLPESALLAGVEDACGGGMRRSRARRCGGSGRR